MNQVKIYTAVSEDLSPLIQGEGFCTDVVRYSDYAALEAKCEALAAEVQAVKTMNDCLSEELRGYESDGAFEGPKMHLLWWKADTPATDAFLAEVRASTLEDLAKKKREEKMSLHPDTFALGSVIAALDMQANELEDLAAQLRQGGAA